jgi:uncharacterized protein YodC (DUF2158 family)
MPEINVGDVVQLRSGGPEMTVLELPEGGSVYCAWFVGGEPKSYSFKAESIEVRLSRDRGRE